MRRLNEYRAALFLAWLLLTAALLMNVTAVLGDTTETLRPTADAEDTTGPCIGTSTASSAMANWWDGSGSSTSSTNIAIASTTIDRKKGRKVTTWAAGTGGYSALVLKVDSSCGSSGFGGDCYLQYTTDAGSNWTTVTGRSATTWTRTTDTIALNAGQSLANLQVRTCGEAYGDPSSPGQSTFTGYDVYTEGSQAGGPGAAAPSSNPSFFQVISQTFDHLFSGGK